MHFKKKTWIVYAALIVVITVTTFIQAKLYVPIKNVVKLEKIIEIDSKVNLMESGSTKVIVVDDESFRAKIHNLFNDIEISRKFFAPEINASMPTYELKLEFIDDSNRNVTYLISIIDDKYISINGNFFVISNNVYNEIQNIVKAYN